MVVSLKTPSKPEAYLDMVYRVCLRHTRNREDAEDLSQEIYVKVARSFTEFRAEANPKTWIYRIAVNHSLDFLRQRKRLRRLSESFAQLQDCEGVASPCALDRIAAEKVLQQLDEESRRVLVMSAEQGLTHREIAGTLGLSRAAVTKRLARLDNRLSDWREQTVASA